MKTNILFIHCHDLGNHLGCYPGNSAQTPNIDRLASEGVVFDQYFAAAPTCTPSRGAMYTGLTPHRNGLMALASGGHWPLSPEVPSLPRLFHDAGYATASFGVWHVSQDFHDFGVEAGDETEKECEKATDNAIRYLDNRPEDRPFFLIVGSAQPHRNYSDLWPDLQNPDHVTLPPYLPDAPEIREELSRFYGDVSRLDACVGRLMEYLEASGLDKDTLVAFTTDHGIAMPLAKGTLYDPGIKIALIIRAPGGAAAGLRCPALASNVDLLPTLLDAVGERDRIPSDLDGHSLWPFIENRADVSHDHIFSEQTWHDFYEPIRAIRTPTHKLIRNFHAGTGLQIAADILMSPTAKVMRDTLLSHPRPEFELYDLTADPGERHNLAGTQEAAEVEARLKKNLNDWLEATDDPILRGPVPAPEGYFEHFMSKSCGPGALPPAQDGEDWLTIRWPSGSSKHQCLPERRT